MDQSISKNEEAPDDPLGSLQKEIVGLEAELERLKKEVGAFEGEIYRRMQQQISRVRTLAALYKQQKKAKKAKRLEQKKRGKNYREPKQLKPLKEQGEAGIVLNGEEQKALKQLYREAVVQFHPDKMNHAGEEAEIQRATAITARLNSLYKQGDLDELLYFYQTIISGSEGRGRSAPTESVVDSKARMASLKKKKKALEMQLEQIRSAYSYHVLMTYEPPLSFIEELRQQFEDRIALLEKRTRKG